MILTGAEIDPRRLYDAGVVNILTEPGTALDAAVGLAERICTNSPLAVRACLGAVRSLEAEVEPRGWAATDTASRSLRETEDLHEGLRAFFEKRPPEWTGR